MKVSEIEHEIAKLEPGELAQLAEWFAAHHMDSWDHQIATDSESGRLNAAIAKANADFGAGNCKRL